MVLIDRDIRSLCLEHTPPMIESFSEAVSGGGVISFGLSHSGYDIRLGTEFLIFKGSYGEASDPKRFGSEEYRKRMFDEVVAETGPVNIPPHSYVLAKSLERFNIPENIQAHCLGKSTLARCGIICNVTPLEPGWSGFLTIEISNATPCPACLYPKEGICQVVFHQLSSIPEKNYSTEGGKKYQNQIGVTVAKVL